MSTKITPDNFVLSHLYYCRDGFDHHCELAVGRSHRCVRQPRHQACEQVVGEDRDVDQCDTPEGHCKSYKHYVRLFAPLSHLSDCVFEIFL